MARASEKALGELHNAVAKAFKLQIEAGECPASLLKEAREFLKDNGISCDPDAGDVGATLRGADSIMDDLPFPTLVVAGLKRLG